MRRRIYSATLMIANGIGLTWNSIGDIDSKLAKRLINDTPTYQIEREIAVRLETQRRCSWRP